MVERRGESVEHETWQRLELTTLLESVATHATSTPGRRAVRGLRPTGDREAITERLVETKEMLAWRSDRNSLRIQDLAALPDFLVDREGVPDRILEPTELAHVGFALDRGHALGGLLREIEGSRVLAMRGERLRDLPGIRRRLLESLDRKGNILDAASPTLGQVRARAQRLEEDLRRWMEQHRESKDIRKALQGLVISMRNGRWVYAVRAEHRRSVRGVVHDRSSTGHTLFIEPEAIVLRGDELSDLRAEERREETRILGELTREVRKLAPQILERYHELVALDIAWARAAFGEGMGGVIATLSEGRDLQLKRARHPLLLLREGEPETPGAPFARERAESRVVPLDLELSGSCFQLVVTGPNTGGKTVVLKTVGLQVLMTYCGIPVPAEVAVFPVFDAIFADIGDEQSIEQNLSTFSSHITVIGSMLRSVSSRSLVLLDELGAGTDPLEGAALAESILEDLYRRGAFTIVTTHLGRLKEYAYRHRKCENASVEFDPQRLAPTYRLLTGLAGKSNALIIAERLGMPDRVIAHARELQSGETAVDEQLIEGIERKRSDLERRTREMERLKERAHSHERTAAKDKKEAKDLGRSLEYEAERAEQERVIGAIDAIEISLRELGEPPKDRRDAWERLLAVLEEARAGTTLAERRRATARGLKKGDAVFVPRLQGVFEVRKTAKAKELLTVDVRGVPTEVRYTDISYVLPPPGFEHQWYEG